MDTGSYIFVTSSYFYLHPYRTLATDTADTAVKGVIPPSLNIETIFDGNNAVARICIGDSGHHHCVEER